jgi:hypothetical protein
MTASASVPNTVEIRRSRLFGGALVVAAAAASLTWALLVYAVGTSSATPSVRVTTSPSLVRQAGAYGRGLTEVGTIGAPAGMHDLLGLSAKEKQYVRGITSLTRVQQAAAFGGHDGIIDAMGLAAKDAQYVKAILSLTPAQLAAGFGTGR